MTPGRFRINARKEAVKKLTIEISCQILIENPVHHLVTAAPVDFDLKPKNFTKFIFLIPFYKNIFAGFQNYPIYKKYLTTFQ